VYLRNAVPNEPTLNSGWTTLNTTELQEPPWYYLRGEEYSRQIDCFVQRVAAGEVRGVNDFRSAVATDKIVAMINGAPAQSDKRREDSEGLFSWLKKGRLGGGG
jgi:hypothetical protein